ncbi:Protein CWH43 [Zancudomyces culisetae]|uniref:Protein CWH43 n=1 Tax=Zancudomyces culisetae TaxID=1213189 RepID=A0A1R1PDN0_ZANCU|nr:Protein CWH43 [Zancudomyces culisetae]|eukprot:OMH79029.1 Protein CWH43 [Zancudomyces culisetae]
MLLILWYYCTSQGARGHAIHTKKPVILFIIGFVRTVTCGGWAYITSSDDHDAHDVFMILYMLLTLPYMLMSISTGSSLTLLSKISPSTSSTATKYRKIVASAFFLAIVPMVYYFIQHKVHAVAGGNNLIFLSVYMTKSLKS